jgi:large repetitive protein
MPTLAGPYQAYVFTGTLTSGSDSMTGISNLTGLIAGESVTGTGIPAGTTILTVTSSPSTITLSATATASGSQSLTAANPTATPDPDLMLASTFGRGSFAINMAPIVFPNTVQIDPSSVNGSGIVTTATPTFDGLSAITGFGSSTRITIFDVTDNKIVGGFDPNNAASTNVAANWTDASGNFKLTTYSGLSGFTTNGTKTIEIYVTDDAGAVGNMVTLTFTLNATNLPPLPPTTPPTKVTLELQPSEAVVVGGVTYTKSSTPDFIGVTDTNVSYVELLHVINGVPTPFNPPVITTNINNLTGAFTLQLPPGFADGTYTVEAQATNVNGSIVIGSLDSAPVLFTIKTHGPSQAPTLELDPIDDSGIV